MAMTIECLTATQRSGSNPFEYHSADLIDLHQTMSAELAAGLAAAAEIWRDAEALPLPGSRAAAIEGLVGTSPALRSVVAQAVKVAPTDATVLVTGETGTGKELIARAIHARSARASRPFVSINCAAVPDTLIASELFGHEKGAFTGALQRRPGRFEMAAGGTLFLDEVGELPLETQVALLRVLQEREFERVGGTATLRADVRIIAATNRDLEAEIAAGRFRSDLYYRLNVFPIEMPALRERREDIPALVEHFVEHFARRAGKTIRALSRRTLDLLGRYPWPGNVRELQNVIERSIVVCESELFSVDETWLSRRAAPQPAAPSPAVAAPAALTLDDVQRAAILRALRSTNGLIGGPHGAAALLGLKRTTLQGRMRKLGISPA
jgi:transcriptional regulator with GAF, ATPase, and Fis domain